MTRNFQILLTLLLPLHLGATNYYVSATGNDANTGTSEATAWKTIARVQQQMVNLAPGDQVLFQRGGIFPGELDIYQNGTESSPIVFGAYGTGEAPIISGGLPVVNWTPYQGNIWRAPAPGPVKYLLVNNEPMTLARYPNTGWLRNVNGSTTQINTGGVLTQSSGYWNGAQVVIRSTNWCYETGTVTGYNNGTLTFSAITSSLNNNDWGFFLTNKLSELDSPGEWYYDASSGQVFFWAIGNANPNSLNVMGSVYSQGIIPGWQKHHLLIENLCFQGQTAAGISTEVSNNVTVRNCTFRHLYKAISSSGNSNSYINNTIYDAYATAVNIYDDNTLIEGNTLTDCGNRPGLGENIWGQIGINITGMNNVVRSNRLESIGYIGIAARNNTLIEKNVVSNAMSSFNDGGGIAFDNSDGMIIQDNVVINLVGNVESAAPNYISYHKICHGIYFGNTSLKNTIVRRNTVAHCNGAGIHVDHTMVSQGNQVKDNVLFDNLIQLSISDFSNPVGPGATAPYYVANFNTVYSGNHMYSIRPEQLCMHHYNVHGPGQVDFGTFTNNKYFNAYEELSIEIFNTNSGWRKTYTMEQWQLERSEDAGSARSPLRSSKYATISELSGDLIVNGGMDASIAGWTAFPSNGQLTRDDSYLDGGALKTYLPNNSLYYDMFTKNTNLFSVQNGQWYRMRFSIQSDIHGVVRAGVKGESQWSSPFGIEEKPIPFSPERRDVEMYFQSDLSDQAHMLFISNYLEPRYWVDNAQLHKVTVSELDPNLDHVLLLNDQATTQTVAYPSGCWSDLDGNVVTGSVQLAPYSSKIVYRIPGTGCNQSPSNSVSAKVLLSGALDTNTGLMRTNLRMQGLLPMTEPYSAMGVTVENAGTGIETSVLVGTGPQMLVDWVLMELVNTDGTISARRAALVRSDGVVMSANGGNVIQFNTTTQGKRLAIRHRNHLAAMSTTVLSSNLDVINMTSASTPMFGQNALKVENGYQSLWSGDVNFDGVVRYTGTDNDRDLILMTIGSIVPSNTVTGYLPDDVNMDGIVMYTGTYNDRDIILQNIGGVSPTIVLIEQLP